MQAQTTYNSLAQSLSGGFMGVVVKFNQTQGMILATQQSKIYGLLFMKNPTIDVIVGKLTELQHQRTMASLTPQQVMQLQQLQQLQNNRA
jgi:hypothetical protein